MCIDIIEILHRITELLYFTLIPQGSVAPDVTNSLSMTSTTKSILLKLKYKKRIEESFYIPKD